VPGSAAPLSDCPHRTRRPAANRSALQHHTTVPTCFVVERRGAIPTVRPRTTSAGPRGIYEPLTVTGWFNRPPRTRPTDQPGPGHAHGGAAQRGEPRFPHGRPTASRGHSSMGAGMSAGKAALQASYKKLQEQAKGKVLAIAPAAPVPNARHMRTYPAGQTDL
jgi:hypothetical protein